ncbi:hypothetical protein Bca4012_005350 [Brassica carinata]
MNRRRQKPAGYTKIWRAARDKNRPHLAEKATLCRKQSTGKRSGHTNTTLGQANQDAYFD